MTTEGQEIYPPLTLEILDRAVHQIENREDNSWITQRLFEAVRNAPRLTPTEFQRAYLGEYPADDGESFRRGAEQIRGIRPTQVISDEFVDYPRRSKATMNLKEVMDSIETIPNTSIALDLSVHNACDFDSNCPKAIRLRELIHEAGIDMGQILQGYAQITSQPAPEAPITVDNLLPNLQTQIDGHVRISIIGHEATVDLTEEIQDQVRAVLGAKLRTMQAIRVSLEQVSASLYDAYIKAISLAKKSKVVEQVQFPVKELLSNKVISNKGQDGGYDLYFPVIYEPGYLIGSGIRYEIAEADKRRIRQDNLFLKIVITSSRTFKEVTLINDRGDVFQHYHGRGWDCWGSMTLPAKWDGTVRQLQQIVHERMGSLSTINLNSILNHQPVGMPTDSQLRDRATQLGREGEIRQLRENEPPITFTMGIDGAIGTVVFEPVEVPVPQPARPGWGRH